MPRSKPSELDAATRERIDGLGTTDAVWRRQNAAEYRVLAGHVNGMSAEAARDKADRLDTEADTLLQVATHTPAPVVLGTGSEITADASGSFADTLRERPDMVAVDASRHRLSLASKAGGLALALDAADTALAGNSLEKMLSHQAAAAHIAAVELQAEALALLREFNNTGHRYAILSTEAARLANASARMMDTTQHGIMTLHRLRTSGRQTLVVQHVHVGEGGQAVVAGQVRGRGQGKRARQGG